MSVPNMLWRHLREISCEMKPKLITYKIPLYMPQERLVFNASEVVITFLADKEIPKVICFDKTEIKGQQLYSVELIQRSTPPLQ